MDWADKWKNQRDEEEGRKGGERGETAGDWAGPFHSYTASVFLSEFNTQLSPVSCSVLCMSSANDVIHAISEEERIKGKEEQGEIIN